MNSRDHGPRAEAFLAFVCISLGLIVGGAGGLALGIGLPMAMAALNVWITGDPTRTAAGILTVVTAPVGLLFGATVGMALALAWKRRREQ